MEEIIRKIVNNSANRIDFCCELISEFKLQSVAELGVYRGDFAKELLEKNQGISGYTMIDPWRNLTDWNKPANMNDNTFNEYYQETLRKTDFAREKRTILRGKTTEVIGKIENESIDLVYIDGDHTLKGITIDLVCLWPKVKQKGFLMGDDFTSSIWQHSRDFEPTLVFPFAVYFAEAVNAKIFGLPNDQFLIAKSETGFQFFDLTGGSYANQELRTQFLEENDSGFKNMIKKVPFASKIYSALKK